MWMVFDKFFFLKCCQILQLKPVDKNKPAINLNTSKCFKLKIIPKYHNMHLLSLINTLSNLMAL